jgi:hypothetical protein
MSEKLPHLLGELVSNVPRSSINMRLGVITAVTKKQCLLGFDAV